MAEERFIRILCVDDDEDDYIIIRDLLADVKVTKFKLDWAKNYPNALELIRAQEHDVYLFDFRLGAHTGLELLNEVVALGKKAPVIFLTGQEDHDIDMSVMRSGAYDYLVKSNIGALLLERSIRYAIERKKMEDELFREKEQAVVTLESIGDSVITADINGKILHLNRIAERMLVWNNTEAQGLPFTSVVQLIHETSREPLENPFTKVLHEKKIVNIPNQCLLVNRDGQEYAIEGTASPIHDRAGQVVGIVMIFHDVSVNRELSKRLSYQASHDPMTGLANRLKFEEQLRELLEEAKIQNQEHVLFYMDLDRFKIINDTCGHFAGDQLLKQIATLMKQKIRLSDSIARLGGDEFGIILQNCPVQVASSIADKICQAVQEYRFIWQEKPFSIGVSIGLVIINANSKDFDTVMSEADQACYAAKEKGGGHYQLYQEDNRELLERHGQMQLMNAITKALENNLFTLFAQPIVAAATQRDAAWFELLIRMVEGKEHLLPNTFLPAAQRYNIMPAIDRWVINNFCLFYEKNHSKIKDCSCTININISGASLDNEYFLDFVRDQLQRYQIPPAMICFEITETIAVANFSNANQFIQGLKKLGCRFALDDFGSGIASFNYLKHLPVDYLKIDGAFVRSMLENPIDYAMTASINEIAHLMGIETIAEFVENREIFDKLKHIGVDYAQGFWIAKPEPLEKVFAKLIAKGK